MLCGKNKTFIRHTVTGQYKKRKEKKNKGEKKGNVRKIYTYRYV